MMRDEQMVVQGGEMMIIPRKMGNVSVDYERERERDEDDE